MRAMSSKHTFLFIILFVTCITVFYISTTTTKDQLVKGMSQLFRANGNVTDFANSKPQRLIVFGSVWYRRLGGKYPYLEEAGQACPRCIFTEDAKFWNISDAVVFQGYSLEERPNYSRPPGQIWVWMYEESPQISEAKTYTKLVNYCNMFNWTMTFRRDSDVFWPYGRFMNISDFPIPEYDARWAFLPSEASRNSDLYKQTVLKTPTIEQLINRKMVAWICAHCTTPAKRESIVSQLQKYVRVDVYGSCGKLSCPTPRWRPSNESLTGNPGIDCRLEISSKYKFYLAFENSLCEDYVTEKYFDTLLTQMVPIVYGAAHYAAFAPKKSHINVADFDNVKSLADYLIYLDKNPDEYLKYFEWRKDFWVQNNGFVIGYCALCDKVWNPGESKLIPDIAKWYHTKSDGRNPFCEKPKDKYTQPKPKRKHLK